MPRINCPICAKRLFYQSIKDLPNFPFCSERCKLIDLGSWMDERYRIEEPVSPEVLSRIEKKGDGNG